ncbi:hypothetical protein [Shewanella cutis]|uniref:Uncharacterized protein n=1 Tax=Shewanella cutis TaxID=2766780 RepID=A0ABS9QW67_9GAMM|nr:hypothetical protein [Shewanella sp. PS-2]MCG9964584.1 hypothetical protein [Shewanella sp. PS-2]
MFRVFGITRSHAEKLAKLKVNRVKKVGKNKVELTEAEFQQALADEIAHQLRTAKPKQLSHDLSTPNICREYMSLIKEEARLLIMHRKEGEINPKTRKPKMEWVVYEA